MHSRCRTVALGVVLTLCAVLGADIANLSAQASDPRIGTWKLNVTKFMYNPESSLPGVRVHGEQPVDHGPAEGPLADRFS
jgi:hypothetical protein